MSETAFIRKYLVALTKLQDAIEEAIDEVREEFLEGIDHTICESCQGVILTGDDCFCYGDDVVMCGSCAPTWALAAQEWADQLASEPADDDARERQERFVKAMEAHCANGGLVTDKCVRPW